MSPKVVFRIINVSRILPINRLDSNVRNLLNFGFDVLLISNRCGSCCAAFSVWHLDASQHTSKRSAWHVAAHWQACLDHLPRDSWIFTI